MLRRLASGFGGRDEESIAGGGGVVGEGTVGAESSAAGGAGGTRITVRRTPSISRSVSRESVLDARVE